jgi:hypothetical protein
MKFDQSGETRQTGREEEVKFFGPIETDHAIWERQDVFSLQAYEKTWNFDQASQTGNLESNGDGQT